MRKDRVLTQDAFDKLLDWLDSDRVSAAAKYEAIRARLIKMLTFRGCAEAEDLADETIDRVAGKLASLTERYHGDPAFYFYNVAQKIHLEHLRRAKQHQSVQFNPSRISSSGSNDDEQEYECLERCLAGLSADKRELVLSYYQQEERAKYHRKRLAHQAGIAIGALRIRAHRIRLLLGDCVQKCLEHEPG